VVSTEVNGSIQLENTTDSATELIVVKARWSKPFMELRLIKSVLLLLASKNSYAEIHMRTGLRCAWVPEYVEWRV